MDKCSVEQLTGFVVGVVCVCVREYPRSLGVSNKRRERERLDSREREREKRAMHACLQQPGD
jgi:hypothetical protein